MLPTASTSHPEETCVSVEKSFVLRCFAYQEHGSGLFVAECIDLDLTVKARKLNKAKRELQDAVSGYVKVAVESGQDTVLIPRLSPASHRLHYQLIRLGAFLSIGRA